MQFQIGGACNRNAASVLLAKVSWHHGQSAVDQLVRDLDI